MNPRIRQIAVLLALALVAWVPPCQAGMVTYEFSGTIDGKSGDASHLFDSIVPGTPFSGTFGYDPAGAELSDGVYHTVGGIPLTLTIGDYTVVNLAGVWVVVHNNVPEDYLILMWMSARFASPVIPVPYGIDILEIDFRDDSGTALDSAALPSAVEVTKFPDRLFAFGMNFLTTDFPADRLAMGGDIQEFHAVPEPSTLLLLGSGLAGLGGVAWRRHRKS